MAQASIIPALQAAIDIYVDRKQVEWDVIGTCKLIHEEFTSGIDNASRALELRVIEAITLRTNGLVRSNSTIFPSRASCIMPRIKCIA